MKHSDVFENFVKIAKEKGMISEDAPDKAIKKLEETGRHSAFSADDIEKLYNVKPDLPKGMEYDKNIAENAHKESVVVSPSYDKLNGLVENINERQNILLNIVNKPTNGHLTNHKMAEKELILNLVRLGNDLDNKNQLKLMSLADVCLEQINNTSKKKINKIAFVPMLVGVSAFLGAIYAQQHLNDANEGLQLNGKNLLSQIDDLIKSNDNYGIGYKFKAEFINEMQDLKGKVENLLTIAAEADQVVAQIQKPKDAKDIINSANLPETNTIVSTYTKLKTDLYNLVPYFKTITRNFEDNNYKSREIEEKGIITNVIDKAQFLHGGKGLISDDFDDVVHALAPFKESIVQILKVLKDSEDIDKKAKDELALTETELNTQVEKPKETKVENPSGSGSSFSIENIESEIGKLFQ